MDVSPMTTPAANSASNTDECDIVEALEQKRKQLDDEIAQFRIQKEHEFREFEASLRRRRKESLGHERQRIKDNAQMSASPGALPNQAMDKEHMHQGKMNKEEGMSKQLETLSAEDKVALTLPSPSPSPSNSSTASQSGRSPATTNGTLTPPAYERDQDFHGLFTPAYLPLLDSKKASPKASSSDTPSNESRHSPSQLRPKPPSPKVKRNSLNLESKRNASPIIQPSTSLPSALRRASSAEGRIKSPKHVTFRLSDFTVVDPSSSYEEMPTPEITSTEEEIAKELTAAERLPTSKGSSAQQHSIRKPQPKLDTPTIQPNPAEDEEDDSVFAFDEDLDNATSPISSRPQTKFLDEEAPDLDVEDSRYSKEELLSGSPAAGSLPISINRPPAHRPLEGGMYSLR